MDRVSKELKKLSGKERSWVKEILETVKTGNTANLDIKKLKGRQDIFRVRKGIIRIIYRRAQDNIFLLAIERRNENTYRDLF